MLSETKTNRCHYFYDTQYRLQGEFKRWDELGNLETHCFYVDDELHGEFKSWLNSKITTHCFYIDGKSFTFYPITDEDRMYFKLKYGAELLPQEQ